MAAIPDVFDISGEDSTFAAAFVDNVIYTCPTGKVARVTMEVAEVYAERTAVALSRNIRHKLEIGGSLRWQVEYGSLTPGTAGFLYEYSQQQAPDKLLNLIFLDRYRFSPYRGSVAIHRDHAEFKDAEFPSATFNPTPSSSYNPSSDPPSTFYLEASETIQWSFQQNGATNEHTIAWHFRGSALLEDN